MGSQLLWRRSATALGIYAATALGFVATVVAAHAFSTRVFGLYALVLAATGFFQSLLDLTLEEALIKYGFRYQERAEYGKLRRLFARAIAFKITGSILAFGALLGLAPLADTILHKQDLKTPLVVASLLPLAQAFEGVAGVALILRGRYDIRSFFLFVSMALRLAGVAVGSRYGLTQAIVGIVVAQVVATAAVGVAGIAAFRRYPKVQSVPLGSDRRGILRFVWQSTLATTVTSLTIPLATLVLGRVASATQVAWFRVALSPQQGLASLSAPARIVLLADQTRDWERGTHGAVFAGVRRYTLAATALMVIVLPPLLVFMPEVVKLLFSAKNAGAANATRIVLIAGGLRLVIGWTKTLPVTIGRPKLRVWTHAVETAVLVPLAGVLGWFWGAMGAAGAVLASSVAFALFWSVLYARIRREPRPPAEPALPPAEAVLP